MASESGAPTSASPRVIAVFVASPEEVRPERELAENTIRDLNREWIETLDLYLDLVKWESKPFGPGIHIDSYVNQAELRPDDYDIFIGLLWGHFHSPPPSWVGAGIVKDFEQAYERFYFKRTCEALFYFKDAANPQLRDPEARARVDEFRARLGKPAIGRRLLAWARGEKPRTGRMFYRDFASPEDLASAFRDDLTRLVEGMVSGSSETSAAPPEPAPQPDPPPRRRKARLLLDRLINSLWLVTAVVIAITLTEIASLVATQMLPGLTYAGDVIRIFGYVIVMGLIGRLIWKLGGWRKGKPDGDGEPGI